VVVIDAEPEVRDLVVDVLTSRGHRITAAAGGREGLDRFEAGCYDVVLTDLGMPDVNGWEVARVVKASRVDTTVLLLTGWADAMDPNAAALVDGVLKKPFGVDELADAVAAALAAR
jgi:CheY-like chemotaxis protein